MRIIIDRTTRKQLMEQIEELCDQLIECADTIEELQAENQVLRMRGELLAQAIESNDWTPESAMRLADRVSSWREFEEREYYEE